MATGTGPHRRPRITKSPVSVVLLAVGIGLLAEVLLSFAAPDPLAFLGMSVLVSGAAAICGVLVGFLFGIPRAAAGGEPSRLPYAGNTNLEQVSDWLTKILVGVGLTQLGPIGRAAGRLTGFLGPVFGEGAQGESYAAAILIYFVVLGFFLGWLPTRVLLGPALSRSDRHVLDLFLAAQAAEESGNDVRAEELRRSALSLSEEAARRYESLRAQAPDPARTAAMATALAPDDVRQIFRKGTEGDRVRALGLMQGDERLADFDDVCDAIGNSRSAFEQLQALRVMAVLAPTLSPAQAERLRTVLDEQTGPGGHIHRSSYRWRFVDRIRREAGLVQDS